MNLKFLFFLWLGCSVLLTACDTDEPIPGPPVEGGRTVLIYVAADNTLRNYALADLEEMKAGMAKVKNLGVHLLVYIDTGSKPRLIELQYKNGKAVEKIIKSYAENRNSTGKDETAEVFRDVFANNAYKAGSYGLIYWSHGEGWIPNPLPPSTRWVGQDTGDGIHYMNITDLVSILSGAPHFDFVLFDACFMQSIEVAYALRSFTDYYIGSPTEIPGPGARYDLLVPALFAKGEVALNLAAAYYDPYDAIYNGGKGMSNTNWTGGVSVGILKSSELESLASITKQVLPENAGSENLRSLVFDYDRRSGGHVGYYDLVQMMRHLTTESDFTAWKQVYDTAVPYWKTTPKNYSAYVDMFPMEGTNGVSHYIPSASQSLAAIAYTTTEWYQAAGLSALGW